MRRARLDVLDLIREVNDTILGLRLELAFQLDYAEHDGPPAGYQYDHRVADALDWISSAAFTPEAQGLADQVLGVLSDGPDALLPGVRRLLGLSTRAWSYPEVPCPAGDCPRAPGRPARPVAGGLFDPPSRALLGPGR